ncbi:S41 family peptidase [Chlorogloeopsis sp. ULAP01]|uniref:S41 family peptidase n=1 Tax=Chlorogloeopsis sp. ULAP01 TaxID=3056483 RepID=UPI0025AAF200|nr:S41 family peptidase [Chlorogloeopsis sp. ULAP01]MDM9384531.1 S41 family peptidase [Chlorogloeopsis sp. ULAP01]
MRSTGVSFSVVMAVLLGVIACTGNKSANESIKANPAIAEPQSSPKPTQESTEAVSLDWFTSSRLKSKDNVSASQAKAFINNVYQTLDSKIFDPAFKKDERDQQLQELLNTIDGKPNWTRAEVIERISSQLKKLSISHLRILDPTEGEKLFRVVEQKPLPDATPEPAISAEIRGEIGILRVKSFLIPHVTKVALDNAKSHLSQAKVILIDLRGNGGGAGSSISYLVEDIVGADKVLWRDRTREGLQVQKPYIFRGYFDDAVNAEAKAEIKLSKEQPFVEWRTRTEAKRDPRPHFILVDDQCGSSCDLFAGIIKDYGSAKILGTRTMGALFGGDAVRLNWQGFALIVPTLQVISPKGNTIEGVGVKPDIQIPECKNSGSQCLEKAIEIAGAAASHDR